MNEQLADRILASLSAVNEARTRQRQSTLLGEQVKRLKTYQAARFELTYADLLTSPRYAAATRFFLDELYGPGDFVNRDQQFARIVPTLVRMFPDNICHTVEQLAELHALSEALDERMAAQLPAGPITPNRYARAWQSTGQSPERAHQLGLALNIGRSLDKYTRNRWLRHSLRMMRAPASAAGLGALQNFLEAGFEAFASLKGAEGFLSTIQQREDALATALYAEKLPDESNTDSGTASSNATQTLSQILPAG